MDSTEKIKEFLKALYSFDDCKKYIQDGRFDKALMLFWIYLERYREDIDPNSKLRGIYVWDLTNSIYGAFKIINRVIGTNFSYSLKGTPASNKYFVKIEMAKPGWSDRYLCCDYDGDEGKYKLVINAGRDYILGAYRLLLFDTEQEAQKFIDRSGILEKQSFKGCKLIIKKSPGDIRAFKFNRNPIEIITAKVPIYIKNKVTCDANIAVLNPNRWTDDPTIWKEVMDQYDL